ncbi:MAG: hypothetical protein ACQEXN_16555 [Actinomycetota bacterium]
MWIGLLRRASHARPLLVGLVATGPDGRQLDAISGAVAEGTNPLAWLWVPATRQLLGISHHDGGWWSLAREAALAGAPSCVSLTLLTRPERHGPAAAVALPIQLTDPAAFERICRRRVPPLQPDSAGGDRLLP